MGVLLKSCLEKKNRNPAWKMSVVGFRFNEVTKQTFNVPEARLHLRCFHWIFLIFHGCHFWEKFLLFWEAKVHFLKNVVRLIFSK